MICASRLSYLSDHGRLLPAGGNSHRSTGSHFWPRGARTRPGRRPMVHCISITSYFLQSSLGSYHDRDERRGSSIEPIRSLDCLRRLSCRLCGLFVCRDSRFASIRRLCRAANPRCIPHLQHTPTSNKAAMVFFLTYVSLAPLGYLIGVKDTDFFFNNFIIAVLIIVSFVPTINVGIEHIRVVSMFHGLLCLGLFAHGARRDSPLQNIGKCYWLRSRRRL